MAITPQRASFRSRSLRPVVRQPRSRTRSLALAVETIQSRLYGLLRWLGLVKPILLLNVGPISVEQIATTGRRTGIAPAAAEADRPFIVTHPTLGLLQRRAAIELFSWLDIDWIPGRFLQLLETEHDPGLAIERFAFSLGCESLAVRRRDRVEVGRFRTLTMLLCQLEADHESISPAQRLRLESLFYYHQFDRAYEFQSVLVGLNEARAIYRGTLDAQITRLRQDASRIEIQRRAAYNTSPEDVEEMLGQARRDDQLARRFKLAKERLTSIDPVLTALKAALSDIPNNWQPFAQILERIAAIDKTLTTNTNANVAQLVLAFEELVRALDDDAASLARRFRSQNTTARNNFPRRRRIIPDDLPSLAAAFFKTSLNALYTVEAINQVFVAHIADHYPKYGDANYHEATLLLREAIALRQVLLDAIQSGSTTHVAA